MENIWLGRFPKKFGMIDYKKMYDDTKEIFKNLNINLDPKAIVGKLSVSQRQMIEIARASSFNAKILVLDEPTSSLTEEEVEHLFKIVNSLRDKGVAIVYISHKMEEILRISDEVTIMRDGKWIATESAKDLTTDKIIKLMVGRELTDRFPPKDNAPSDTVLMSVENLTGKYGPTCKDVSFNLHEGEILGIAGLVGSRRTEILETIYGYRKLESGKLKLRGKLLNNNSPKAAIKNKIALLTEERRHTGIIPLRSIEFNSVMADWKKYKVMGFIRRGSIIKDTKWVISSMNVKTPTSKTFIKSLSGGNQQKVIIGRWLLLEPDVLLLDEPTRGIDVGAKYEIYQLIINEAKKNKGIIVVSSEMTELIGLCDRILVMSNGRLAGEVRPKEDAEGIQEKIMALAAKFV